jgi:predicted nucleic acid-binding protein
MVILDAIDDRWKASVALMKQIPTEGWDCSTSSYTVLELLDRKKEDEFVGKQLAKGWSPTDIVRRRRQRQLTTRELFNVYDRLTEAIQTHYSFVTFHEAGAELLDSAEEICGTTNLWAADSLHLATAMALQCAVLVTRDTELQRIGSAYVPSVPPESVDGTLQKLGFRV